MNRKVSLSRNFVRFSCLLFLIVFTVSGLISFLLCVRHIRTRSESVSGMTMAALSEKTNEALVSVERVINAVLKLPEVGELIRGRSGSSFYSETVLKMQVERQIASLLVQNRDVDGVVLRIGQAVMTASNSAMLNLYLFQNGPALSEADRVTEAGSRNGYHLYAYHQGSSVFDCVVYPVPGADGQRAGSLTVVPSRDYLRDLGLEQSSVLLSDGSVPAPVSANGETLISSAPLNWEGWSVSFLHSVQEIRSGFRSLALWWILACLLLAPAVWGLSRIYIRRTFLPVQRMADSVRQMRMGNLKPEVLPVPGRGSLKLRLNAFFAFLIVAALSVDFILLYPRSSRIAEQYIGSEMQTGADLIASRTSSLLERKRGLMREVVVHSAVQAYMDPAGARNGSLLRQQITEFLSENGDVLNIALYDVSGALLFSSSYREQLLDETGIAEQLAVLRRSPVSVLFKAVEKTLFNHQALRMGMPVMNISPTPAASNLWGYILIDWDAGNSLLSVSGERLLSGAGISFSDSSGFDPTLRQPSSLAQLLPEDGLSRAALGGEDLCVVRESLPEEGWTVFVHMPWETYVWRTRGPAYLILAFSGVLLLIGTLFSRFAVRYLLRDIDLLLDAFRRVKEEGPVRIRDPMRTDEIALLAEGFNRMMEELDAAVADRMASELAAKDAEIHARELELELLQQQIKPHFLYNTLRTIQYMIIMGNASAAKMVDLLITLFRTGINAENMMIPVREELEHVNAYIGIQKIRFPDLFDVRTEVEESILDQPMLKLLLQPLVENAINHGIREGNEFGHLEILGRREGDLICFEVTDNGVGMAP